MKDLFGGKGANLAEMTNMGLPVPHGFTISTEACLTYLADDGYPDGLQEEIEDPPAARWRRRWARSWATRRTRCWCPSAAARSSRCRG